MLWEDSISWFFMVLLFAVELTGSVSAVDTN